MRIPHCLLGYLTQNRHANSFPTAAAMVVTVSSKEKANHDLAGFLYLNQVSTRNRDSP